MGLVRPMDAAGIVEQINGCSQFFASQGTLLSCENVDESEAAMVTSIVNQIASLRSLDVNGGNTINGAITASTLRAPLKRQLAEAVPRRVLSLPSTAALQRRTCQTLKTPCAYFTVSDWLVFDDDSIGIARKIHRMVDRMAGLGLMNPSEGAIKHLTAMLAAASCPSASPSSLHALGQEIKSAFQGKKARGSALPHIAAYPDDPSALPDVIHASGYTDEDDPPVERTPPGFAIILQKVPMRTTHKSIGGSPSSAAALGGHQQQGSPDGVGALANLMQQFLAAASSSNSINLSFPQRERDRHHGEDLELGFPPRPSIAGPSQPRRLALPLPAPLGVVPGLASTPLSDGAAAAAEAKALSPAVQTLVADDQLAKEEAHAAIDGEELDSKDLDDILAMEAAAAAGADALLADGKVKGNGKTKGKSKAKAKGKPKAVAKGKSKAVAKGKAKAAAKEKAKAAAAVKEKAKAAAAVKGKANAAANGEASAVGKGKAKAAAKGTAKALAAGKCKAKANAKAPPAGLMLGCGKCRGSRFGCIQCREPSFGGRRWQAS